MQPTIEITIEKDGSYFPDNKLTSNDPIETGYGLEYKFNLRLFGADYPELCGFVVTVIIPRRNLDVLAKLHEIVTRWESDAMDRVPPEYAGRGLHDKYFRMDNESAGMMTCADEIAMLLKAAKEEESCLKMRRPLQTAAAKTNRLGAYGRETSYC